MGMDLLRQFDEICNTGIAIAGYTSGLCGEWTEERFQRVSALLNTDTSGMVMANQKHTDKIRVIGIEDVLECFREAFSNSECEMFFKKKNEEGKYLLDLGAAISLSLHQEGVKPESIYDEGHCTYHTTTFSSWRRTGDKKKQILTYIMLR